MSRWTASPDKHRVLKTWLLIQGVLCLVSFNISFLHPNLAWGASDARATEELGFIEIGDVYAAAKHLQSIKDAPSSIVLVTSEDIKYYGHRQLTDVINNVPGFYTYSDRNYDYIGVRGFARLGDYGNRVLQLVDGHTYNDNVYGSFFLGHDFGVDIDLIKKIEFIRGPGSSLYGSNALFGVVNVITKKGADIDGLYAKVAGGSYGTRAGTITFGKQYANSVDLVMSANILDSKGQDLFFPEFQASTPSQGWSRDADGERSRKFTLKGTFHEVTLLANLGWRAKNIPTGSFGTIFDDNRARTTDERAFVELKWDHPIDASKTLMTRMYYDQYRFDGIYPYDYPPVTLNRDEVVGRWVGGEIAYDQKAASHHFLFGAEVVHHLDANQKNFDEMPFLVYLDDHRSFTTWSLYGQDEWDITSWLRFTGGLRFDHYSTFGQNLSPRAGLILKPFDTTTVKLLYGQAFRAPNVFEQYYRVTTGTSLYRDNPDLKPETIHTYEIVLEKELTSTMKISASGFHYEVKDLITQQTNPDGSLQFQNVSRVKSDGIEVGIEMNWPGLLKGRTSYSYQDTRDDTTDQWLANSPRHLFTAGVQVPLYQRMVFLGTQMRYLGNRKDRDGGDAGDVTVMDLNLSVDLGRVTASAGVYNLFDKTYGDPVSADHTMATMQQNGRNVWLKVGITF